MRPQLIRRIIFGFLVSIVGYVAYSDLFLLYYDPKSVYYRIQQETRQIKQKTDQIKLKISQAKEGQKSTDQQKAEIEALTQQIEKIGSTLRNPVQPKEFWKFLQMEAKRARVKLEQFKWLGKTKSGYFIENGFRVDFSASYVSILTLIQRLSQSQTALRVDELSVRSTDRVEGKSLLLSGSLLISTLQEASK